MNEVDKPTLTQWNGITSWHFSSATTATSLGGSHLGQFGAEGDVAPAIVLDVHGVPQLSQSKISKTRIEPLEMWIIFTEDGDVHHKLYVTWYGFNRLVQGKFAGSQCCGLCASIERYWLNQLKQTSFHPFVLNKPTPCLAMSQNEGISRDLWMLIQFIPKIWNRTGCSQCSHPLSYIYI